MSNKRIRAQGVIYTTLVDFLLQIIFLLVLLLAPVIIFLDKEADAEALNKMHPHVKAFLPKMKDIKWEDLELALVPKAIAKAYAAEPLKLEKDLNELMDQIGLNPKISNLQDIKQRLSNYKTLAEKAAKYDKLQGKPKCSLEMNGEPYVSDSQPLLDVILQAGGFRIKPYNLRASNFLTSRVTITLSNDYTFYSRAAYLALMQQVNRIDPTCNHTIRLTADETPSDAKEEYKKLMQAIDLTSYKQQHFKSALKSR